MLTLRVGSVQCKLIGQMWLITPVNYRDIPTQISGYELPAPDGPGLHSIPQRAFRAARNNPYNVHIRLVSPRGHMFIRGRRLFSAV